MRYYLNMWFRQNLGLKIISVLIAACLWAFVMVKENPLIPDFTIKKVRIVVSAVPQGLTVLDSSPETGEVTVSGLRRLVAPLSPTQVVLTADLSGQDPGTHTVALKAPYLPRGVTLVSVAPTTVRVTLDKTVTETHAISVKVRGEPAAGFVFGPASPRPAEAKVTGAATLVARLSRLVAEVRVSGVSAASEVSKVPVAALDDQGEVIPGLRVDPPAVAVALPVTQGMQTTKTVPVRAQLRKSPGSSDVTWTANPREITLTGRPEALAALESVATEVIPLEGLLNTETYQVKVVLPAGVKREGEGLIEVTVKLAKGAAGGPPGSPPATVPSGGGSGPPPAPGTGSKPVGETPSAPPGGAAPEGKSPSPGAHAGG